MFRDEFMNALVESGSRIKAVIIDAAGVADVDLSALAVIDELVSEMGKQDVEVFIAAASSRVIKSLEAYELLEVVRAHLCTVLCCVLSYYRSTQATMMPPHAA